MPSILSINLTSFNKYGFNGGYISLENLSDKAAKEGTEVSNFKGKHGKPVKKSSAA
ncbi:MAG: hypothetical protein ACI9KN_001574 [Gammaproteobacteria bacterium]|jgi:hypothetical protein